MLEFLFTTSALFANTNSIFDHMLSILMMYSFLKLVILSSILELLWPTHFFNKRNNFDLSYVKQKNFLESLLKITNSNPFVFTTNKFFIRYYLY